MFGNLVNHLYGLKNMAVSHLTLERLGKVKGQCDDTGGAILGLDGYTEKWNNAANSMPSQSHMESYANSNTGLDNSESIRELWGYLLDCNVNPYEWIHKMSDSGYKMLDMSFKKLGAVPDKVHESIFQGTAYAKDQIGSAIYVVPNWVKKTAGWWSEGKVSDGEFVNGLTYLIKNGIIKVSAAGSKVAGDTSIPEWIKSNAGWWASDKIGTQDFVNGIQYLIQHGIIRI